MRGRKILVSAYSCAPNAGSEKGIGWNWARLIAETGHQVTVITRCVEKKHIDPLRHQCAGNPEFVFHDLLPLVQKIYALPFGSYLYYLLWQYTAAKRANELHRMAEFDQVHHITWGSFRAPSFMGILGIPFIFGPVGGGEDTPKRLRKSLGSRGRVSDALRRLSNRLASFDVFMRFTYESATQILVTTAETLAKIPANYRHKARIQPAIGVELQTPQSQSVQSRLDASPPDAGKLELLYAGRLLPWKGLHLALLALAKLGERRAAVRLTVVGTGSDEGRLKRIAGKFHLGDSIRWIPWMARAELLELFRHFDLLLFPSLHDSGGMAVLEALSCGLPVVCLDLGGPSKFVDRTCGRVISTIGADENQVTEKMAAVLREFIDNPSVLGELSAGARRKARELTWHANVRNVYGDVALWCEKKHEAAS